MPLRIVVDVFSGRENPVIRLSGRDAREVIARLQPVGPSRTRAAVEHPVLGYRGLLIEQTGRALRLPKTFRLSQGAVAAGGTLQPVEDRQVEEFIFAPHGPAERAGLSRRIVAFIRREITRTSELRAVGREGKVAPTPQRRGKSPDSLAAVSPCAGGPIFEPDWWNDNAQRQLHNNCYNYATNYRTDTFAQPGRVNGGIITAVTCGVVKPFAILDNLIDAPNANNKCPPKGHLVALVMAPGFDFHWYRKGPDGMWTHKVGPAPATSLDNAGNTMVDPRSADRGPYTDFCGFMVVMHGHVRVQ